MSTDQVLLLVIGFLQSLTIAGVTGLTAAMWSFQRRLSAIEGRFAHKEE